ncbi:two component transcriptional regulator, LytTR family [Pedobacter sp. ok626]|uniref:LytR/AlgR family response regulator transcription factor n=1 Tax=Pedobacter sp. ok626 TaxID=1761882 RepID=UPI000888ABD9|nr:LytTR family DNA-binding domain-containing protein [Pedobacter sp. ok626]SDK64684.1 two component transcriptional regulator, LytTR family [Pedobacter sp. ok626]
MTIDSLIIEDELPNARRLEKLLNESAYPVQIVGRLQTVKEAVIWLKSNPAPSLIFMDIRLSDGLSFEIYKNVELQAPVIFTTAYDEYALQAFKVNSVDYLLKPIDKEALEQSLHKFSMQQRKPDYEAMIQLFGQIQSKQIIYRSRFLITFRDQLISVAVEDIAYFGSSFRTTFLVTHKGEKHYISQTLEELEKEINPSLFFRITRQYLVCNTAVCKIHVFFNGKLKVELLPPAEEEVVLSRDKSIAFKEWLDR